MPNYASQQRLRRPRHDNGNQPVRSRVRSATVDMRLTHRLPHGLVEAGVTNRDGTVRLLTASAEVDGTSTRRAVLGCDRDVVHESALAAAITSFRRSNPTSR